VIIPQFLSQKRYPLFVLGTLTVIGLSAWLRSLVAIQMSQHFFHDTSLPDTATLFVNSTINISFWVLLVTVGRMILDNLRTQQLLELSEKEKIENELNFLKAQINPHALFNSLNTIYGQIDKNNTVAKNTLLQFSELLRYQLYDCSAEKVPLEKELAYIKNYVSFQQLRKGENLKVSVELCQVDPRLEIAPLLWIVLIENAFKHVSNFSGAENKISIQAYMEKADLVFLITNTTEVSGRPFPKEMSGIGMINLNRRLELLYPRKYDLNIQHDQGLYQAKLTLKFP
jgi:LytS/YehU family sensor histidine kinase